MAFTLENRNGRLVAVDDQGNEVPVQFGDTVHESVNVDDLDIGGADFVAQNDFVPLYSWTPTDNTRGFTNTSYSGDDDFSRALTQWDQMGAVTAIQAIGFVNVGTDETVSFRIRNVTDSETVVEETGITSNGSVVLGPTTYTPTTTSSFVSFRWEWKTDTGTNSNIIRWPTMHFGVQL